MNIDTMLRKGSSNADIDENLIEHAEHRFTATAVEAIRVAHRHHETIRARAVYISSPKLTGAVLSKRLKYRASDSGNA